ncbi:hypothetical protein A33M_0877 [Rhodovulum sp. PH10]|uniref:DUF2948 family protein n=1 Tax=Rhodovulum sp. PH10 TaxID=1187851 RepID=UPI00027C2E78|nr:DUF2948 family protein [Rhodovulum sp. PH10]EJW09858.1 hypothetical protein A33M_0877 [Rhodovulum sp. PH10]
MTAAMTEDQLKLVALDQDDLDVVATHLQDAIVKVGDIHWRPSEHRLVMGLNRFDWECAVCGEPQFRRRRTALRFDRVMAVKCRNVACQDKGAVLNLLTIEFVERDAPGGSVVLIFSGGSELRLDVECLEAELADLGPVWDTTCCPAHEDTVRTA